MFQLKNYNGPSTFFERMRNPPSVYFVAMFVASSPRPSLRPLRAGSYEVLRDQTADWNITRSEQKEPIRRTYRLWNLLSLEMAKKKKKHLNIQQSLTSTKIWIARRLKKISAKKYHATTTTTKKKHLNIQQSLPSTKNGLWAKLFANSFAILVG